MDGIQLTFWPNAYASDAGVHATLRPMGKRRHPPLTRAWTFQGVRKTGKTSLATKQEWEYRWGDTATWDWPHFEQERYVGAEITWGLPHVPPSRTREPKLYLAANYLGEALSEGERLYTELREGARVLGIGERTLDTAKARLRVYDTRHQWGGAVYWGLPTTRWIAWVATKWVLLKARQHPKRRLVLTARDILNAPRPVTLFHAAGTEPSFQVGGDTDGAVFWCPAVAAPQ